MHENRISILRALQAFLVQTDNNKFGYAYIVNKESDLTPTVDTNLEPMDHYIHDMVIVNVMCRIFEDTGVVGTPQIPTAHWTFLLGQRFLCTPLSSLGIPHSTSTAVDTLLVLTWPLKRELSSLVDGVSHRLYFLMETYLWLGGM
jgi:hypothetical protein